MTKIEWTWRPGTKGESRRGDERRDQFVAWLRKEGHVHWVEVSYAEDEPNTRTTRASDMPGDE